MKLAQYCMLCGCKMELDFESKTKKGQCPRCKTKFKYKVGENGSLDYIFKTDDVKDMYVGDKRLIDIAKGTEVKINGTV